MRTLRTWLVRCGGLFGRPRRDRELAEEIDDHLQMHVEDNLRAGMSPDAARRDALLQMGSRDVVKESCRDRHGLPLLESVAQDIRFAARFLKRNPSSSGVAIFTLALGIAGGTTIFSVVDAIVWHPLPFNDASRLARIWSVFPKEKASTTVVSTSALQAWTASDQVFDRVLPYGMGAMVVTGVPDPEAVTGALISNELFATLGVRPNIGRDFVASDFDSNHEPAVILSDKLWRREFAAMPDAVGGSMTIDQRLHHIVGVMPAGFSFPVDNIGLWVPLPNDSTRPVRGPVLGRLQPGVTVERAQTIAANTTKNLSDAGSQQLPELTVMPFVSEIPRTVSATRILLMGVGLLFAIAVANAANVRLAEGVRRDTEIAIRMSIGAGRWRVARQLLTETLLLGAIATVVAIALAWWALDLVRLGVPYLVAFQSLRPIAIDWRALIFAMSAATIAGVAASIPSMWRVYRTPVSRIGGATAAPSARRFREVLLVGQIAIAFVLLVCAGLLGASVVRLSRQDPGYTTTNVVAINLELSGGRYPDAGRIDEFLEELVQRVRVLPGILSASAATAIPPRSSSIWHGTIETADARSQGTAPVVVQQMSVDEAFFDTLRVPVMRGRVFDARDSRRDGGVVISASLAQRLWPGASAVNRRFRLFQNGNWLTVLGVVGDVKYGGAEQDTGSFALYEPRRPAMPSQFNFLLLRTQPGVVFDPATIRATVRQLDPDVPISSIDTADDLIADSNARIRFATWVMAGVAVVALILALGGVYGAFWCAIAERMHEMGIRIALGADQRIITSMVLRLAARLTVVGLAIGMAMAALVTGVLRGLLFGISATDPVTFTVAGAGLFLAALLATLAPARRASRANPVDALRAN
jgi:putative ABC transport system permease protein